MSASPCPRCGQPAGAGHACPTPDSRLTTSPAPPSEEGTGRSWVILRECADAVEAQLIAGFLDSGGLHIHVESRTFRQEPMPAQRSFSRVVLWVHADEADEARRVLAGGDETGTTCPSCGGPLDGAVCPACAEAAAPEVDAP